MLPASATRPDAATIELFEATWPLLMPIETLLPALHAEFDDAIRTLQLPSKVAAAAGVASGNARRARMRTVKTSLLECAMTYPRWLPLLFGQRQLHTVVRRRM